MALLLHLIVSEYVFSERDSLHNISGILRSGGSVGFCESYGISGNHIFGRISVILVENLWLPRSLLEVG